MSKSLKLSKAEQALRKKSATPTKGLLDYGPNVHAVHHDCQECLRRDLKAAKSMRKLSHSIHTALDIARELFRISNRSF